MSDLISRQAAIDGLRDYLVGKRCPDDGTLTCRLIENEVINKLPSAQTEIIRCKDCKHNPKLSWFGCPMSHLSEAQRPETAWCWKAERREENRMSLREEQCKKVCRILDNVLANRPTERDSLIVAVREAFKALAEPHWIPVTERLPEADGYGHYFLVCLENGVVRIDGFSRTFTTRCPDGFYYETDHFTWRQNQNKVVAWMPLPEPYKGVTT